MTNEFIDFSSKIIQSGDIDPDYIFLKNHKEKFGVEETIQLFKKKLLIYNLESELLYHTGQIKPEEIKFGSERRKNKRHFLEWEEELERIDFKRLMTIYNGKDYSEFRELFKTIKGMGDWATWKAADIMNKVFGVEFSFSDNTFLEAYEYPLRGLLMVMGREEDTKIYKDREKYLNDFLMIKEISKDIEESDMFSAGRDILTLETCLCKFHSYKGKKYHVGEDLERIKAINFNKKLEKYWGLI